MSNFIGVTAAEADFDELCIYLQALTGEKAENHYISIKNRYYSAEIALKHGETHGLQLNVLHYDSSLDYSTEDLKLDTGKEATFVVMVGAPTSVLELLDGRLSPVSVIGLPTLAPPAPEALDVGLAELDDDDAQYGPHSLRMGLETHPWPDTTKPLPPALASAVAVVERDLGRMMAGDEDASMGEIMKAVQAIREFNMKVTDDDERAAGREAAARLAMLLAGE